jgi:hypothetical protein
VKFTTREPLSTNNLLNLIKQIRAPGNTLELACSLLKGRRKDLSIIFIDKPGLSERAKHQLHNTLPLDAIAADHQVNYWQFCFSLFPVELKVPHR